MSKTIAIIDSQGFSMLNFRGALIERLVADGHRVFALTPELTPEIEQGLVRLGAKVICIPLSRTGVNPMVDLGSILELRRTLIRVKPDISFACTAKPVIYGTIAAWLAGVARRYVMIEGLGYVFIDRSDDRVIKKGLRKLVESLYRFSLSRAGGVFFLNRDDIADFISMKLVQQDKVILLGGIGVDLEEWPIAPPVTAPITFTFVGRLLKDKGIQEFVGAARTVKAASPNARFVLVGDVDTNPEAIKREQVESWVQEGLVEWTGHVAVKPWLEKTSVFVLPSYREGMPRSTQEAMAMGRPVITTDVAGCRETVIDGSNGYLVPVRDSAALAAAMQRFIDEPALIDQMGKKSRLFAEERFDVKKVNARIVRLLGLQDT